MILKLLEAVIVYHRARLYLMILKLLKPILIIRNSSSPKVTCPASRKKCSSNIALTSFNYTIVTHNYLFLFIYILSSWAFANLKIFFKENEFITSKRSELYGRTDFLASCGGLIGLFIGVTALSFVEFFYYFTLRLAWTLRMYRYGKSKKSPRNSISLAPKETY